jgi:hypothetical protein
MGIYPASFLAPMSASVSHLIRNYEVALVNSASRTGAASVPAPAPALALARQ